MPINTAKSRPSVFGFSKVTGTGKLVLTSANTYTGLTTVSAGTVNVQSGSALGATAAGTVVTFAAHLQVQGGITVSEPLTATGPGMPVPGSFWLESVSGNNTWAGSISSSGPSLQIGADCDTLSVTGSANFSYMLFPSLIVAGAGDTTISGSLGVFAGVSKQGSGTFTLRASCTYGTAVTINDGTMKVSSSWYGNLGNITNNSILVFDSSNSTSYGGVISGTGSVTKSGAGALTLSGANTYSGDTIISAGRLVVGSPTAIPSDPDKGNVTVDGTLDLNGKDVTLNGLSGSGTVTSGTGAGITLTVGGNDQTSQFSGLIEDGAAGPVALSKIGAGTLTLAATNTYSGGETVSGGTLLVGDLPSVFAATLTDGVTLDAAISTAVVVGDPGASGGTFDLSVPGLTGGVLTLGELDGIMHWTPSEDCPAGSYSATATYTYAAGVQIVAFTLDTETENADMPPSFVYSSAPDGPQHWKGCDNNHWSDPNLRIPETGGPYLRVVPLGLAFDREGQITTYQVVPGVNGCVPAHDEPIGSNGLMNCYFSPADAYKAYQFDVIATDSSGQTDKRHVVLGIDVYCQGSGVTEIAVNTYAAVDTDSGPNRILLANDSEGLWIASGQLVIDEPPSHGDVEIDPNEFGCVLYMPTSGYRGLDLFQYHWVYNKLDYWTQQIVGTVATNIATEQVQVGNWGELVPQTSYQNDAHKSIMGVGDSETTTLTLQNPRGDGLSSRGYWDLCFDRSLIRVYDSGGKEILPGPGGSTFLETVGGEKTVTLTVVGVGGGRTDLIAEWHTWACGQTGVPGWFWQTSETVHFTVVAVDIYDVGRGGKKITDLTSTIVVGQENSLIGIVTPGDLDASDPLWVLSLDDRGNMPIAGYSQTTKNGVVYDLSPANLMSQTVDYYWIADGQDLPVDYGVTVGGRVYSAQTRFNVLRPTATLASTTPVPVEVGPSSGMITLHFGLGSAPSLGIIWNASVTTGAMEDGEIAFTQLVNTSTIAHQPGPPEATVRTWSHGEYVLDGGPPQYSPEANIGSNVRNFPYSSNDSPYAQLANAVNDNVSRLDYYRTYLMYKSDEAGSIWVTLCRLDWYWQGMAAWDSMRTWHLVNGTASYSHNPVGLDSTELPKWDTNVRSLLPEVIP
jgi:autotransporter-associated beta strand protein